MGGSHGSKVFSTTLTVYADEIIEQSRQFAKGFDINDETINFEEIKNIRLIDKKLNYNSIPYRGRLIVNLLYGKKRSFLVSSNIDHAKAILEAAGFSLR